MKKSLQIQFSNVSRSHNVAINEIKELKKEISKREVDPEGKTELENQLLFWERMLYIQRDQISEIIHEAVRRKINIEINGDEEETIALIDFYAQRNISGHKIITTGQKYKNSSLLNKFLAAYCSENNYIIKHMMSEILS